LRPPQQQPISKPTRHIALGKSEPLTFPRTSPENARIATTKHSPPPLNTVDAQAISKLLISGVAVLTVQAAEGPRGMTVSSFSLVSYNPGLILVAVNRDGEMHTAVQNCTSFGLSVLTSNQVPVARHFASRQRPRGAAQFTAIAHRTSQLTGVPLLDETVIQLDCLTRQLIHAGDHDLLIGEIIHGQSQQPTNVLIRIAGTYRPQPI
jgi:flavin reductase (DIM6/NTAB) family NADH-FMN oxidoreductase RutF